jgi:hypothetical protein
MKLYKTGTLKDVLWQGRLVWYNVSAFLLQKFGDSGNALKFIYDIQAILLAMQKANAEIDIDLVLWTNLLTFTVLWSIG